MAEISRTSEMLVGRPADAQAAIHSATLILNLSEDKRRERYLEMLKAQRFQYIGILAEDGKTIKNALGKTVDTLQSGDVLWRTKTDMLIERVQLEAIT